MGALANGVSLTYFWCKERKGMTNHLFMALSFWDFLVCLRKFIAVVYSVSDENGYTGPLLYVLLAYNTCFVTVIIAVTRAISISKLFYHIRGKLVVVAFATFTVYMGTVKLVLLYKGEIQNNKPWQLLNIYEGLVFMTLTLVTVIAANIKCVMNLVRPGQIPVTKANRNAVKIVFILSVVFCLTNIALLASILQHFRFVISGVQRAKHWTQKLGFDLCLILNSACNPIVYLIRKHKMRDWLKQIFFLSIRQENKRNNKR